MDREPCVLKINPALVHISDCKHQNKGSVSGRAMQNSSSQSATGGVSKSITGQERVQGFKGEGEGEDVVVGAIALSLHILIFRGGASELLLKEGVYLLGC